MPYIKKEARLEIESASVNDTTDTGALLEGPGELNYFITKILLAYINQNGISYSTYNEVIGVLESVKLELYRRQVGIYEDKKCKENGDVY